MIIERVGVIGAGVMGAGIAERCAMNHFKVVLVDVGEDTLRSAKRRIIKSLDKFVEKSVLSHGEETKTLARIEFSTLTAATADVDLVIEAVNEDLELKKSVFRKLDKLCEWNTILASNTSSIPISRLANETNRPENVLGLHFMNPAPLINLVEMILTPYTSETVAEKCKHFAVSLGCEVVVAKDTAGFIINRVLMPMLNEAAWALESGVADAEDIDKAMVLGTHQPMGPLALADHIGLDVVVSILNTMHEELKEEKYRPCPIFEIYAHQNWLGRKTGRGFFEYPGNTVLSK